MVTRKDNKLVLWLDYFDINNSRDEGRRVPRKLAKENLKIEDVVKVARVLGLSPVVEEDAAYPRRGYKKTGRVLVDKKWKKTEVLRRIAQRL